MASRPPALQALYDGFSRHQIPAHLSYCSYCDDAAYEEALHAPIDTLPIALVDKYLADAIHHTGTAEDFLHFLPRILEHEHDEGLSWFWVLPQRLEASGFPGWLDSERGFVLDALVACATRRPRDDAWLATLFAIPGVDWPAIFRAWPNVTDPVSLEADWMETALMIREICAGSPLVNEAFRAWLDSEEGGRFAAEHTARMAAWRSRALGTGSSALPLRGGELET